jgi:hypothetical protein
MALRVSSLADHTGQFDSDPRQSTMYNSSRSIRVMIVDDHLMTVETMEAFLACEPGIDVVATAADGLTALVLQP